MTSFKKPSNRTIRPIGKCRPGNCPIRGAGFFDDAGNWFKKAWTGTVQPFLKKTKIISKGAPIVASVFGQPEIALAGKIAGQYGYGNKRRTSPQFGAGPKTANINSCKF